MMQQDSTVALALVVCTVANLLLACTCAAMWVGSTWP